MATIDIKGNSFYYEIHGEGEPIVLAHGLGGNHATWYKQVAVLAKAYQVITFDHRGFGNSSDIEAAGRSEFSNDLLALLDHLNIEKAALLGQSMGGGTAITFTCQHPERVSGLIIADSLHALVESDEVANIMSQAREDTANLTQVERVLGKDFAEKNQDEALLYQQLNSFNNTDRSTLSGQYSTDKFTPSQLAQTGVLTMFLAGQDDILFPIEAIRLVQEQVEGSFIVEFDQCGHSAFFEKPTEFNDSVLSFLQMAGLEPTNGSAHSNSAGYAKA
ncbi:alpha/beta hydrolase [Shewanella eurypsychrophilus]|uniref:Alpha/beta hydrolase n=1 Tax=Shewanella eurypsychrophilus TaxID=2593656 RepID=A0ABX6V9D8_9GAMM|nr:MULTISPECIES: alpha/beta hydrolase [Shewanella]QFU24068.1 alpha/beta fold hydrolase [Shewanella sp. YLB-09]QPG59277.1 alpha/beta hydrolase [Shewanella eurypsychrophilus]